MITTSQLAEICGVSIATVDRALRNRGRIASETKKKILLAAKEHGYAPNPSVREIINQRSSMVGGIIPVPSGTYSMDLMKAVKKSLAAKGYQLMLTLIDSLAECQQALREFAARRFAAAVLIPDLETAQATLDTHQLRVLSLVHRCHGEGVENFIADTSGAVKKAMSHLYRNGHRRILMVRYPFDLEVEDQRQEAYHCFMAQKGLDAACMMSLPQIQACDMKHLSQELMAGVDEHELWQLFQRYKPTAIITSSSWLALRLRDHLAARSIQVPQQCSIISLSADSLSLLAYPELTHLASPIASVAKEITSWAEGKILKTTRPGHLLRENGTVGCIGQ